MVVPAVVLASLIAQSLTSPAGAQALLLLWSRGPDVADWQQQLNRVQDPDIAVDGIFGPVTASATRRFQRSAGIQVDGVVGPETRAAIRGGPEPAGSTLRRGDRGPEVRTLQQRLRSLRYWVGPIDGVYGGLTQQAVTAFQKVNGLTRDGVAGAAVGNALESPRRFQPRSNRPGLVMEVDESTQVLVAVIDGNVADTWNTSTGTEEAYFYEGRRYLADTPNGEWRISRQIDGWRESNLGRLYRPKYFHEDGIAIHGYPYVPPQAASHGCVRVSMDAMDYLWTIMPIGTPVLVY